MFPCGTPTNTGNELDNELLNGYGNIKYIFERTFIK